MKIKKCLSNKQLQQCLMATCILGAVFMYPSAGALAESPPRLHVVGKRLLTPTGAAVMLRGFNLEMDNWAYENSSYDPTVGWHYTGVETDLYNAIRAMNLWNFTEGDFRRIRGWGANLLRLQLPHYFFEEIGRPGVWREEAFAALNTWIGWARDNGLYVLIDLHVPYGGRQYADCVTSQEEGRTLWHNALERQYVANWWQEVARRLGGADNVLYEVMNEPWPEYANMPTANWWQFAQTLIDTIRAAGSSQIIVVPFTLGETPLPDMPLLDPAGNLAYDFHFYKPGQFTHQQAFWVASPFPHSSYPYADGFEYLGYTWDMDGSSHFPGAATWTLWREAQSGSELNPDAPTHFAPALGSYNNDDAIRYDNVKVFIDGIAQTLYNADFSLVQGYFPDGWSQYTSDAASNALATHEPNSDNWYVQIPPTPQTSSRSVFPTNAHLISLPAAYHEIAIEASVRGGNTASAKLYGINWFRSSTYDGVRMARDIEPYLSFARTHNVPLMCLEFGVIMTASEADGHLLWLQDLLRILDANALHGAYHSYRGLSDEETSQTKPGFGIYQCWGKTSEQCPRQFTFVLPTLSQYFRGNRAFCWSCLPGQGGWRAAPRVAR